MLCRRMRLTERHLQPPREPLEGPIVRPCTARKLMNLDTATSHSNHSTNTTATTTNDASSTPHPTITIPTGDDAGTTCEGQPFSPRGRKLPEGPKTPLVIVNLNIPPGTETLAPKSASRSERHKLPHFCMQYRNLGRLCSAPPGCAGAGVPTVVGTAGPASGLIPQIFIQSFELQDRRAADGPAGAADHDQQQGSQRYNIITENDEDTFATLLLDNISNISLEMIQRHQQKLLGTTASSITESPLVTGVTGSATCFQHVEGCSSMERTESKTSTEGLLPLDGRMDSHDERDRQASRGQSASGPTNDRLAVTPEAVDDQNPDIPAGYRSLCYRTPSPKTRQIIRVDIVTSREKY
ncbi:uncharacterized protein LOC120908699 [Anopheles arabiensis]|uniref:uncharacterized protein LOC120908699 n=1 Tax=Anopheles arabiensis TaxID=7173 RepID=UPI001AAD8D0F|nr:uncharacterized protein LOC120908699 [Anopheles arabiensis]